MGLASSHSCPSACRCHRAQDLWSAPGRSEPDFHLTRPVWPGGALPRFALWRKGEFDGVARMVGLPCGLRNGVAALVDASLFLVQVSEDCCGAGSCPAGTGEVHWSLTRWRRTLLRVLVAIGCQSASLAQRGGVVEGMCC